MERQITAREADERFDDLLRDVAAGESFTVTKDGRPVARVVPVDGDASSVPVDEHRPKMTHEAFMAYLRSRPFRVVGPWTRDELYD